MGNNGKMFDRLSDFEHSKMCLLGRVIPDFIHDVNNPLGTIKLYVEEAKKNSNEKYLDIIGRLTEDAINIVRGVGSLSALSSSGDGKTAVSAALRDAISFLRWKFNKEKVEISESYSDKMMMIKGPAGDVKLFFCAILLCINTCFKKSKGKKLSVSTVQEGADICASFVGEGLNEGMLVSDDICSPIIHFFSSSYNCTFKFEDNMSLRVVFS